MKTIKVYTTSTCPNCDKVKDFLKENDLDFETIDAVEIFKDEKKTEEFLKMTDGVRGVPITTVDDKVIIGYDEKAIEELIK